MAKNHDSITLTPFWFDTAQYNFRSFRYDLIAALSVALLALPQAMAYAFVAELPPSLGIFSAVFGTILAASFGSSPYVIAGPSNTIAILIQAGISEILYTYYRDATGEVRELLAVQIALQLTLVVGLFQLLASLLKLGRLTQFASKSVVIGYTVGASLAILITQLYYFLGIREMEGLHPLFQQGWFILAHLKSLHVPTALIGIGCLLLIALLQKTWEKFPAPVMVFAIAGLIVYFFNLAPDGAISQFDSSGAVGKVTLLKDFGPIYTGLPSLSIPFFEVRILTKIVPLAFAITLLSIIETTSIGQAFARTKHLSYSNNQEILGLGISNVFCAFLSAMPSSGSFSRSSLNHVSGARTRFAAIYSGIFLLIIVALLGFVVTKIPLTALSALMLYTAFTMINFRQLIVCLKATRTDSFVVIVTIVSSLLFNLDVALYVGVVLSVILYLRQAAIPDLVEFTFNKIGKLRAMENEDERLDPRIRIINIEGELFFGAADLFQIKLREIAEDENLVVLILQIKNAHHIDASACLALTQLNDFLKKTNRFLLISGVTPEVWEVISDAGLVQEMGPGCFFLSNNQLPSESTRNAYAFAKILINE